MGFNIDCTAIKIVLFIGGGRIVWQSARKNAHLPINFFGCPFRSHEIEQYSCIHGGEKQKKSKDPTEVDVLKVVFTCH